MIFGVFDLFHPGHHFFIDAARHHGHTLIAVVTRDDIVHKLKHKRPQYDEQRRLRILSEIANKAVLGDSTLGAYQVVKDFKPSVICCGYDQDGLAKDLAEKMEEGFISKCPIIRIGAYHPEKYSTTKILNSGL